jgi:hypothetical protein
MPFYRPSPDHRFKKGCPVCGQIHPNNGIRYESKDKGRMTCVLHHISAAASKEALKHVLVGDKDMPHVEWLRENTTVISSKKISLILK